MKSFRPVLLAAILLSAPAAAAEQAGDPVVAKRGTDQITASQARAMIASTDAEQRRKLTSDPSAIADFLRNALLQQAILEQAQAEKWDQRADVAALAQRAHDLAIAQSFLTSQAAPPPAYPAQADIEAAYETNKARLMQPRGYHLAQIFTAAGTATAEDQKRKLGDLRTQILRGRASFEDPGKRLAGAQYADLGWLADTQILPAIKTTVAGLLEGAMSEPVCTANGCHLIKLVATRPAGPAPLAEVKDQLIRALRQQREADGERAYANALLAKQPVQVNEIQLSQLAAP